MKNILYLMILILLSGCNQKETKIPQPKVQKESEFKTLLTKYKDISFDTLEVFSTTDFESNINKFKGIHLNNTDVNLFPKKLSEEYENDNSFFACYKFSIDNNRIGLLTRTPSTYEPSSIKLLIFD